VKKHSVFIYSTSCYSITFIFRSLSSWILW